MLPGELDRLAIFKARLAAIAVSDPWHPVLVRYVALLDDRVSALGGDPAAVPPSYEGYPQGHGCGRRHCDDKPGGHARCRVHHARCRHSCFQRFVCFLARMRRRAYACGRRAHRSAT